MLRSVMAKKPVILKVIMTRSMGLACNSVIHVRFPHTKTAQFHCTDDILRANNRADHYGHNHGSQASNLSECSNSQLIDLEAASALGIECCAEIACDAWQEAK